MNEYAVRLEFERPPKLSTRETAPNIPAAIEQALKYARACGFTSPLKKKFVQQVEQQEAT